MVEARDKSSEVFRKVLRFMAGHWIRHKAVVVGSVLGMTLYTLSEVVVPVFAGRLVDAMVQGQAGVDTVVTAFTTMATLGLASITLSHFATRGAASMTLRTMTGVIQEAFHRVQRLSTDWHVNRFAGTTVRQITRGMWAVDALHSVLLLGLLPAFVMLVSTVLLLAQRWPTIGLIMASGAAVYIVLSVMLTIHVVAPAALLSNALDSRIGGVIADALGANAVVKSFGGEAREDARLMFVLKKWSHRTLRTWMRHIWSGTSQATALWMIRTGVTAAALSLWWKGRATAGEITYVLTTYFIVHSYLRDVGQQVHQLQHAVNEMEGMVCIFDEPLRITDPAGACPLDIHAGEVKFEHVSFGYSGREDPLFRDLNLRIAAGERVGLVGHSGSGKTTFVKLIQRLYDVDGGRIVIDGQNISHGTQESLRSQIALVPQEPILFHRSIAENIAYARPDASFDQIEFAARLANAHDFICQLPRGYGTLVGERGVKLSGGERQRVALARAFLADAPILILDEATSSLDSESEHLIQEALGRLMSGRTSIVIAHRLSTVRAMDRILVFEHGKIVEDGDHESLVRRPHGRYRRLFARQSGNLSPEYR